MALGKIRKQPELCPHSLPQEIRSGRMCSEGWLPEIPCSAGACSFCAALDAREGLWAVEWKGPGSLRQLGRGGGGRGTFEDAVDHEG